MRSLLVSFLALSALTVACASTTPDSDATSGAADTVASGHTKVLLDCNVFLSGGPDQQVTIVESADGSLTLKELTDEGNEVERSLSEDEWESGSIQLRHDDLDAPDSVNLFYKQGHEWMYKSDDAEGNADCS